VHRDLAELKLIQDSFYKKHTPEELELGTEDPDCKLQTRTNECSAFANKLDFDHPDSVDMPMFAAVSRMVCLIDNFDIDTR
jgi:hypothetical protein